MIETWRRQYNALGITQSMNRPGKRNDNTYYHWLRFEHDHDISTVLRDYMPFYNRQRLHSSLNYVSPATYEKLLA